MGTVMFNGLALVTAPGRVMTPRAPSEQLVATARARLAGRPARVADIGTGSGAIAIAIAIACPNVEVWATDISGAAVALARANVRRHQLERPRLRPPWRPPGTGTGARGLNRRNLPYVAASTAAQHPDLVSEPVAAVFAAGDGLEPYRRLVDAAAIQLADGGALLLQLNRRVVEASRSELPSLRAAFGNTVAAAA